MFELLHYNDVAYRGRHFDREWVCRRLHERWGICQGEDTCSWKSCQRSKVVAAIPYKQKSWYPAKIFENKYAIWHFAGTFRLQWGLYMGLCANMKYRFVEVSLLHTYSYTQVVMIWGYLVFWLKYFNYKESHCCGNRYMMFARIRSHYGLLKGLAVSMSPHVFLYRRVRQRVVQSVKFEGQDYFESLRDG